MSPAKADQRPRTTLSSDLIRPSLGLLWRLIFPFLLQRLPDGFVANKPLSVRRHLARRVEARLAVRNLGDRFLLAHRSPIFVKSGLKVQATKPGRPVPYTNAAQTALISDGSTFAQLGIDVPVFVSSSVASRTSRISSLKTTSLSQSGLLPSTVSVPPSIRVTVKLRV